MSMITDPNLIQLFRYKTLLKGLSLEMKGLQLSRGRSCYAIIKSEFGLKGNKENVYKQFEQFIQEIENGTR